MLPIVGNWSQTLSSNGVPTSSDPYDGLNAGSFIALSSINPTNWTRSYSRAGYIDPLPPRSNLAILPNATVTRIIFSSSSSGNLTASSVEYASSLGSGTPTSTVNVTREVILAGGSIGSPHVLMHSGIGPSDVLNSAGVTVLLDLPGVGQHLQDHISAGVSWQTTADTSASLRAAGAADGVADGTSSAFLSFVNAAEAYLNLTYLLGSSSAAETFAQNVTAMLSTYAGSVVPSNDSTVKAGYEAIYNVTANTFMCSELGHVELLLSAQGQSGSSNQTIEIQAALQHPLSQGRLYITSSSPFTYPSIDPQYLSHNADLVLYREALKLARQVGQTPPLSQYLVSEVTPGSSVQTDDDWDNWLANNIETEYHPQGTCAMLPKEQGGVVNARLQVYGTSNVRVVDASVFPIAFAAHVSRLITCLIPLMV